METGKSIGTDPNANQLAARGSTVTIIVSKGPEMVVVPDCDGLTVEACTQQLSALGLHPDVKDYGPGKPVAAMDPGAGGRVPKGSTVTLFL